MRKPAGNFLVLFRPGVVTGIHNENEVRLRDICEKFGGYDCKIFDPYLLYAKFADAGLLVRVEQRNIFGFAAASFFYPDKKNENVIRNKIINEILGEMRNDPKLIASGYAVVSDNKGNLKLASVKKQPNFKLTQPSDKGTKAKLQPH